MQEVSGLAGTSTACCLLQGAHQKLTANVRSYVSLEMEVK